MTVSALYIATCDVLETFREFASLSALAIGDDTAPRLLIVIVWINGAP